MSKSKTTYTGIDIDVEWQGKLCIHIAECGKSSGKLFVGGRDPWCKPDLTSVDDTVDVVKRCPSGALSFLVKDGSFEETADKENTLAISYNGPYFIRGELDIDDAASELTGVKYRAALCRCGASKNKPFCDNSHEQINFKDYGAVGEKGEPLISKGGKLSVSSAEDGPLILNGNLTIKNGSGNVAWSGQKVALCRCGESNNKPFCDGSHVAAGFKST